MPLNLSSKTRKLTLAVSAGSTRLRTTALVPEPARREHHSLQRSPSPSPIRHLPTKRSTALLRGNALKRKAADSHHSTKASAAGSPEAHVNLSPAVIVMKTPVRHKRAKFTTHMTTPDLSRAALEEFSDSDEDEHSSTTEDEDYDHDVETSRSRGELPPDYEYDHFAKKYWVKMAEKLATAKDSPRRKLPILRVLRNLFSDEYCFSSRSLLQGDFA